MHLLLFRLCIHICARVGSDRVVFMANGVICEEGTSAEIFGDPKQQQTRDFLARFRRG